jgi:hypothetical protein
MFMLIFLRAGSGAMTPVAMAARPVERHHPPR